MCYSKNVIQERDAPDKFIFGTRMDPTSCTGHSPWTSWVEEWSVSRR